MKWDGGGEEKNGGGGEIVSFGSVMLKKKRKFSIKAVSVKFGGLVVTWPHMSSRKGWGEVGG